MLKDNDLNGKLTAEKIGVMIFMAGMHEDDSENDF